MFEKQVIDKLNEMQEQIQSLTINQKSILNFKEACQYLGISTSHLYKLTSKKEIDHSCPNGKRLFFERSRLDEYMLRNPQKSHDSLEKDAANYINTKSKSI